jgi:hypothetical protein
MLISIISQTHGSVFFNVARKVDICYDLYALQGAYLKVEVFEYCSQKIAVQQ